MSSYTTKKPLIRLQKIIFPKIIQNFSFFVVRYHDNIRRNALLILTYGKQTSIEKNEVWYKIQCFDLEKGTMLKRSSVKKV